jgi:hypothetical protein
MPGTVLVESVGSNRLVAGNPARLVNIPLIRKTLKARNLPAIGHEILEHYRIWLKEFEEKNLEIVDGCLIVMHRRKYYRIGVDRDAEISLLSDSGARRPGMYFNLATLRTDGRHNTVRRRLEAHMRLYFGLTFLDEG